METRKNQISKAGRVTVPFYNPPTRQYGQTPSEIIREARASVMNMPTTGIKPVSTSRPYTPKEKERILFGNVKRRLSRPPSAFSLSYLQRPEALPRVKLPAIQSPTQKKTGHNNGIRSVLSLDNLPEDYESEVLEDSEFDFKVLPVFQQSGTRSSDKKMTRAATLTSKISLKIPLRSEINFPQPYVDFLSCSNDDIYLNYSEEGRKQPEFQNNSLQQSKTSLFYKLSDSESEEKNLELSPSNENVTSIEKASSLVQTKLPGHSHEITDEKEEMCKLKLFDNSTEEIQPVESTQIQKFTEILPQSNDTGSSVDNRQFCTVNGESSDSISRNSNVDTGTKSVSLKEKCVATEIIPKYFSLVNNGPRHTNAESCSISKEIHELYETASYYGVFSNQKSGNEVSVAQIITTFFRDNDILKNVTIPHSDFATGKQEFGWFKGYFENVKIFGLDAYKITKFEFTLKQQQVNISVPQINFIGYYDLDGMLNFPMGNKPIHVFGKGDMKMVIQNVRTSIILKLKSKGGKIQVDKLLISVNIGSMNVKLSNLMGGGDLEDIFNEYFSVLGPTLFDYYKNDIIEDLKEPLVREINIFLDSFFENLILGVAENVLHLKINES